jgi:S-adenosylmethionine:tRNA-ribosyltransferase-isomerase (queuine synthetase)
MCTSASKATSATTTARKRNKRRLSFAPVISQVVGTVLSRDDITAQEKKSCWYSCNEYVDIRAEARTVVEFARKHRRELTKMLQASYNIVGEIVDNFLDDHEFESLMMDPSPHKSVVEKWCLSSNDCRGLEKSMTRSIRNQRSADASEARGMVFQTGFMRLTRIEIAHAYAVESQLSCVYARMMAHADYQSVYCMEPDSKSTPTTTAVLAFAKNTVNQDTKTTVARACLFLHERIPRLAKV